MIRSMPHALVHNRVHIIFSTKAREKSIPEESRSRLWAFMGGIARKNGFTALMVGGFADHAHALLEVPTTMPLAKAVQLIKGGSSKWCNQNFTRRFAWQEGYYGVSVSPSHKAAVVRYIQNQEQHHAKHTFEDELMELLNKSGTRFDPDDVLG